MNHSFTRTRALLAGSALSALLVAALPASAAAATIRLAPTGDLKTLDPLFNTAYITRNHGYMVFDTLFSQDSKGEVKPQMVDTWTSSEDGKNWSFTLRDKIQFNDGSPVKAEDAVASIERWAKKDTLGRLLIGWRASIQYQRAG